MAYARGRAGNRLNPATGLFEQFAGYYRLEDIDVVAQRGCATPIDTCLGPERIRRSKAVKQADVVALSPLLWKKMAGRGARGELSLL